MPLFYYRATTSAVLKSVSSHLPLVQQQVRPAVNIVRPTIVGGGLAVPMNHSSVITSVLRPVMTTGIAASVHGQRHQVHIR